ncbi:MAG TPA: 4Fe-4S binding protein, partial [Candidatus Omnitrophota bacterium]|nr:4Fe-4S binding protein [Candidatus Omnitrophota bacterium]
MPIQVIIEKCTGCTVCVKVCPFDAIRIMDKLEGSGLASDSQIHKKALIDLDKCNLCGACFDACKFKAILLEKDTVCVAPNIKDYKGIWVFIEQKNGTIQSIAYELLGKAHELAKKLNTKVSAILIGNKLDEHLDELFWHGADNIYLVEAPEIANFQDEPYTNILVRLIQKYKPEIVLCGATSI